MERGWGAGAVPGRFNPRGPGAQAAVAKPYGLVHGGFRLVSYSPWEILPAPAAWGEDFPRGVLGESSGGTAAPDRSLNKFRVRNENG
jgi:hypothetical protein